MPQSAEEIHPPLFVAAYCPMGCSYFLKVTARRTLVCSNPDCPRPAAAAEILEDRETDHIVTIFDDGWKMRHPLKERLDDELDSCTVFKKTVSDWTAREVPLGRYRVSLSQAGDPVWTALEDAS